MFTRMERVLFGQPAAEAIVAEAERIQAKRVFVLRAAESSDRRGPEGEALGSRFAGVFDHMPDTRRVRGWRTRKRCTQAGTDLLVTFMAR